MMAAIYVFPRYWGGDVSKDRHPSFNLEGPSPAVPPKTPPLALILLILSASKCRVFVRLSLLFFIDVDKTIRNGLHSIGFERSFMHFRLLQQEQIHLGWGGLNTGDHIPKS